MTSAVTRMNTSHSSWAWPRELSRGASGAPLEDLGEHGEHPVEPLRIVVEGEPARVGLRSERTRPGCAQPTLEEDRVVVAVVDPGAEHRERRGPRTPARAAARR